MAAGMRALPPRPIRALISFSVFVQRERLLFGFIGNGNWHGFLMFCRRHSQ